MQRIAINRFWNEMEEFYNRRTDRSKTAMLPAYTTDCFDHAREEAENDLNDKIERMLTSRTDPTRSQHQDLDVNVDKKSNLSLARARLESSDVILDGDSVCSSPSGFESSSEEDEDEEFSSLEESTKFIWNDFSSLSSPGSSPMPSPPKTLPDLKKFMF